MQQIRKLNPRLTNPDHIESGQKIRLPATATAVGGTENFLLPVGMVTPEQKDVQ